MMLRAVFPAACGGWLVGVSLSGVLSPVPLGVAALVGGLSIVTAGALSGPRGRVALVVLVACFLGLLWADRAGRTDALARDAWGAVSGTVAQFEATADSVEQRGAATVLRFRDVVARIGGRAHVLPGILQVTMRGEGVSQESGRARLIGRAITVGSDPAVPGSVARSHRAAGVVATMRYPKVVVLDPGHPSPLTRLRAWLHARIRRVLPEPEAGVASALLLSFDKDVSRELRDTIAAAGLAHILAISGSHMVVASTLLTFLAVSAGFGRSAAGIVTLFLSVLFLALTGFPASGVRSVIMGALVLWAFLSGRRATGVRVLLLAVAAMTFENPRILLGDVGFQLSALATWGLVTIPPLLRWRAMVSVLPRSLPDLVIATFAAELATFPLIASIFGRISLIGLLANLIVVPLFPVLLVSAFLVAIAGPLPHVGPLLASGALFPHRLFVLVAEVAARIPGARLVVPDLSLPLLVGLYSILFLLPVVSRRAAVHRLRRLRAVPLGSRGGPPSAPST